MKNLSAIVLAALLLTQSQAASALCTLLCWCSASTSPVGFGIYNPLSASPLDNNGGKVTVSCGGVLGLLVPYEIGLDMGANSTTFSPRKMASGGNLLEYDLYIDSGHTTIWQDTDPNWVTDSITIILLGGTSEDYTIYGRIPGSQSTVPPGYYSDTVHVTVTYH